MIINIDTTKYKLSEQEWDEILSVSTGDYVNKLLEEISKKNRFFIDEKLKKIICQYIETYNSYFSKVYIILDKGTKLYRARIYEKIDAKERFENQGLTFQGYDAEGSFISPNPTSGRCNPSGIAYLYVSECPNVAISEINPYVSDYVSVATIEVCDGIKCFDCSVNFPVACESTNYKHTWLNNFILDLKDLFGCPVKHNDLSKYYLCQYISEFIKSLGFGGLKFYSSHSRNDKVNYTIFDYQKCKAISSKLYIVNSVNLETYNIKD